MSSIEVNTPEEPSFMNNTELYTEYAHKILETFFQSEANIIEIQKRSDQLHIRPMLVNTIKMFAEQQQYTQATLHLGEFKCHMLWHEEVNLLITFFASF